MRWQLALLVALVGCPRPQEPAPIEHPCSVSTTSIDFGEVRSGSRTSRELVLRNDSPQYKVVDFTVPELPFLFVGQQTGGVFLNANSAKLFEVAFQPDDGRLHFAELSVVDMDKSDNVGRCELTVSLRGLGSGLVTVSPQQFTLRAEPGETRTQELMINNSQRTPVTVSAQVQFREAVTGGPVTVDSAPLVVPAFGSVPLVVTATPPTPTFVRGNVIFTLADDGTTRLSEFALVAGKPVAQVMPTELNAWRVPYPGNSSTRRLTVRNVGNSGAVEQLKLRTRLPGVSVEAIQGSLQEFSVTESPQLLLGLAQDQSVELEMRLWPLSLGPKEFKVKVLFDDQLNAPMEPDPVIEVMVRANVETMPSCTMTVEPVDTLQLTPVNGRLEGNITFTNTGSTTCIVDDPHLSSTTAPGFFIVSGATTQAEVAAGASYVVTIAGPLQPTSGTRVGALERFIFNRDTQVGSVELRAP